MNQVRNTWDRLENEPESAYERFLAYRNLGPSRTVERAYRSLIGDAVAPQPVATGAKNGKGKQAGKKSAKKPSAPGQWVHDCAEYNWVQRVTAWDIATLSAAGPKVAAAMIELLGQLAVAGLRTILDHPPKDFSDALKIWEAIAPYVTPEVIAKLATAQRHSAEP